MQKKLLVIKWVLVVTKLFNIAVNHFDAPKSARYSRILVSGIQCTIDLPSMGQGICPRTILCVIIETINIYVDANAQYEHSIITARQRSCKKVMFSVVRVCQSACSQRGGGPCNLPPDHRSGPSPQTCLKLFNLGLTVQSPAPPQHETYANLFITVGKRWLACFLVLCMSANLPVQ